jgi:hypothetical protein
MKSRAGGKPSPASIAQAEPHLIASGGKPSGHEFHTEQKLYQTHIWVIKHPETHLHL